MGMKEQTAVDFLINGMLDNFRLTRDLIEQAKEKEKQQIIDAFDEGNPNGLIDKDGEQYFLETFNQDLTHEPKANNHR